MKPSTFAGETDFEGGSANVKAVFGGGFSVSHFTMSSGWEGYSISVNLGVGEKVSGAVFTGQSNSVLLNQETPTAQRSWLDRIFNKANPVASGVGSYLKNQ